MTQFTSLNLLLYLLTLPTRLVLGHGHMRSPRSRNYIAHIEGNWSMEENVPKRESCPHCLNSKQADGFCGIGNAGDYDEWYDSTGLNHMPWSAQYDLVVGEEFTVDVWLDTNHAGHMELYMCNLDSLIDEHNVDEVQACLDAFPLEFVRDNSYGIPQDTNYKMRAYFADVGRSAFEFVYKVPDTEEYNNIAGGGRILMQWYYATANSCFSPGYKGTAIGDYLNSKGWLRSGGNLSSCNLPFDKTGQGSPERFWNCAEVSLTHGGPAPPSTPYPTSSPASSPVGETSSPASSPASEPSDCGYCVWETCNGIDPGDGWCHQTDENCEGPCNGNWCTNISRCNSPNAPMAPAPTAPVWAPTTSAPQPVAQPPVSNPTPTTPTNGNLATTTRYWDCSGGACGCGYLAGGDTTRETHCHGNAMFEAPTNNEYGAKYYGTAAVSPVLFNPSDQGASWLGEGCGKCWKVTGTSNIQGYGYATTTLVLKGANLCPASNAAWCGNGAAHFDISAPGFDYLQASLSNTCQDREPNESDGFGACGNWMIDSSDPSQNCDCSKLNDPVLRAGCENFFSLKWNNVNVVYEEVSCPYELDRLPCWDDNNGWPAGIPEFCAANIEEAPPNAPPATSQPTLRPTINPTRQPVSQPVPTATPPPTSQPTRQPTVTPTSHPTSQPVPPPVATPTPPAPTDGEFCCTNDFINCRSESDWCSQSASNCNTCNSNWIIPQAGQCIRRWGSCGNDPSGCCSPGQCVQSYNGQQIECLGNGSYCQCKKV